jgi:hypothetical protein
VAERRQHRARERPQRKIILGGEKMNISELKEFEKKTEYMEKIMNNKFSIFVGIFWGVVASSFASIVFDTFKNLGDQWYYTYALIVQMLLLGMTIYVFFKIRKPYKEYKQAAKQFENKAYQDYPDLNKRKQ